MVAQRTLGVIGFLQARRRIRSSHAGMLHGLRVAGAAVRIHVLDACGNRRMGASESGGELLRTYARLGKTLCSEDNAEMDSRNGVKRTVEEVEALTGCPVQVIQDSSVKNLAVLDIARGRMRLHRIRIHPSFAKEADYITCFQCGLVLRKFAVPPEKRFGSHGQRPWV